MPEKNHTLKQLQKIADAIAAMFGKNCETCIHDLSNLQNSLVYINGSITGRTVGAPATDLLVRSLKQSSDSLEDLHNYRTTARDGRSLKSSTIFIRDPQNTPIYALCINFDTTDFFNAAQSLTGFLNQDDHQLKRTDETFANATGDTIEALFEHAVLELGKQPATMTTEEKTNLVAILENNGAFQFKGAVEQIALLVGVSKYTIYNYLKKIHARQSVNLF